jgi:rRNA biogenesis protein RRP5
VQCLTTAISSEGLVVQALGFFAGTIDEFHLPPGDPEDNFKLGQKLKARILYQVVGASPPRFALSLAPHVLSLTAKHLADENGEGAGLSVQESFPIGTILESAKVTKVESERGLIVQVGKALEGFVHVSVFSTALKVTDRISLDFARLGRACSIAVTVIRSVENWVFT